MKDTDYRYILENMTAIQIGAKYTYRELVDDIDLSYKYRCIIKQILLQEVDADTTLESHLYYMTQDQFSYRTYKQLKARVKISVLREKKTLFGGTKVSYQTETVKLDTFTQWNLAQKKKQGVIVQELILSKLALMTFTV